MDFFIPRTDLPHPRETSSLLPARDKTSMQRSYLGQDQSARRARNLTNNMSQALVQLERAKHAGFSVNVVPMHPFKIYQPTNYASFATGITFLDPSSGVGTVCNIDATKPTDFTSNPPTVNPSESWRFWSVRTGLVAVRPIYSLPEATDPDGYGLGMQIPAFNNSDGVAPFASNSGYQFDDPTTNTINPPLIISGPIGTGMFVWAAVTMDSSASDFPDISISAAPYSGVFYYSPVPRQDKVPVGWVIPSFNIDEMGNSGAPYWVNQILFDNAWNLFPPGNGNFGSGGVMNFRGKILLSPSTGEYDDLIPTDLGYQVMYPGDIVTQYGTRGFDILPNITVKMFQYCGTEPSFIPYLVPSGGSVFSGLEHNSDWKEISKAKATL